MNLTSSSNSLRIFQVLQDETRIAIFICLTIYQKLTVKQLSTFLGKGKTTINHHLRKMDGADIIKWEEKEEDKKKLKTRYFSLNYEIIEKNQIQPQEKVELETLPIKEKQEMIDSLFNLMKIEASVTSNLIEWMLKYTGELRDTIDLQFQSFMRIITLTPETLPIYQEAIQKIEEKVKISKTPPTHISSHVLIPIKDILEWKQKKQKSK